jgi:hypothetical protein
MKKRTCLRLGIVGLTSLVIVLVYLWLTAPTHRIDRPSFEQLSDGMTKTEVEAILRAPPGKHSSASAMIEGQRADGSTCGIAVDEIWPTDEDLQAPVKGAGGRAALWAGDRGMIMIVFDPDDRLIEKQFVPTYSEGYVSKVRNWLAKVF